MKPISMACVAPGSAFEDIRRERKLQLDIVQDKVASAAGLGS